MTLLESAGASLVAFGVGLLTVHRCERMLDKGYRMALRHASESLRFVRMWPRDGETRDGLAIAIEEVERLRREALEP